MRIVITGIGVVSAIGLNADEMLDSLLNERTGVTELRYPVGNVKGVPVGMVKLSNEQLEEELKVRVAVPRSVLLGIKAAREAVADAKADKTHCFLVNGTTVGGMDVTEEFFGEWLKGDYSDINKILDHETGSTTERMAQEIGIIDERSWTVSTACSSSLNSIIVGANILQCHTDASDFVIAGGTECLTDYHLAGFASLGILDSCRCRPFDANRCGLNLGEGAAYVVLEREEHAVERGAHIYGYIAGYGNAADAYHQTASSPEGTGAQLAMRKALDMAMITSEQVDYVNAHGTGTENNDNSEAAALKAIFGTSVPVTTSTKSFTGHTTSAAGAVETVICLLAMENCFVPGNLNLSASCDDGLRFEPHNLMNKTLRYMMCNSFGFGGNDSSLLLSRDRPVGELPESATTHLISNKVSYQAMAEEDYKVYIAPMEARRLNVGMRGVIVAAHKVLEQAGISSPDAIITATRFGCISNTCHCLESIVMGREIKPACFMLSTHNTVSSVVATHLKCHSYNVTISNDKQSLRDAFAYGDMLLGLNMARNVLVLEYEEVNELWCRLLAEANDSDNTIKPKAVAYLIQ